MQVFLFLLGALGGIVSLALLLRNLIKKRPKKKAGIGLAVSFALIIISISIAAPKTETVAEQETPKAAESESVVATAADEPQPTDAKEEPAAVDPEPVKPVDQVEAPAPKEKKSKEKPQISRNDEIKRAIETQYYLAGYNSTSFDHASVNDNFGTDADGDYIALVYLTFDIKNGRETGNKVMKMYSDDLVARLAKEGITDIAEAAVFWEDEYNNRSTKYAYEYKNGAFYVSDIIE